MSVSLVLIPIALTLRVVMGKKNFNNWAESMQLKVPTIFKNELELVQTVRKAGYDAEKWGGSFKTHLDGEQTYFFWEQIDGIWTAVFGKSDSQQEVERFMAEINRVAEREIFGTGASLPLADMTVQQVEAAPTFPTNFRDGELLFRTLKELGINPVRHGSEIACKVEDSVLTFRQSGDGPYHVEIRNAPDLEKVFFYLSDVDDDYKRLLQSIVYEKLKERAAERSMTVESEEVLEDNSIVLTLNIRS